MLGGDALLSSPWLPEGIVRRGGGGAPHGSCTGAGGPPTRRRTWPFSPLPPTFLCLPLPVRPLLRRALVSLHVAPFVDPRPPTLLPSQPSHPPSPFPGTPCSQTTLPISPFQSSIMVWVPPRPICAPPPAPAPLDADTYSSRENCGGDDGGGDSGGGSFEDAGSSRSGSGGFLRTVAPPPPTPSAATTGALSAPFRHHAYAPSHMRHAYESRPQRWAPRCLSFSLLTPTLPPFGFLFASLLLSDD